MGTEKKCKCECGDTKPLSEAEKCAAELRKLMKDKEGEEKCALCRATQELERMRAEIDALIEERDMRDKEKKDFRFPTVSGLGEQGTVFNFCEYTFNPYD